MRIYRFAAVCIAVFFLLFGNGCTKTVKQPEKKVVEELKGNLTILSLDTNVKAVQQTAENFKKKYPNVKIDIQEVSKSESKKKFDDMALSSESNIDIVIVNDSQVQALVKGYPSYFSDLSSIAKTGKEGFIKSEIDTLTLDEKTYGVPFDTQPVAMLYRTDIFENLHINAEKIKTWDDFIAAGKTVKTSGKYMLPAAIDSDDWLFRILLNELNTFYFDKDGNPIINSDKAITSLGLMKRLFSEGLIYIYSSEDDLIKAIKSSDIVAVPLNAKLAHKIMEKAPEMKGKWQAMELPAFEAGGNRGALSEGNSFMITENSKDKKLAEEFVAYAAMDKDNLSALLSNYGMFPAYTPIYNEDIIQKPEAYSPIEPLWKVFARSAVESYGFNYSTNFEETKKIIPDYVKRIVLIGEDPKIDMDDLQTLLESKIK